MTHPCQYPRGERPDYDFCGEPVTPGQSYCAEHFELTHKSNTEAAVAWAETRRAAATKVSAQRRQTVYHPDEHSTGLQT